MPRVDDLIVLMAAPPRGSRETAEWKNENDHCLALISTSNPANNDSPAKLEALVTLTRYGMNSVFILADTSAKSLLKLFIYIRLVDIYWIEAYQVLFTLLLKPKLMVRTTLAAPVSGTGINVICTY